MAALALLLLSVACGDSDAPPGDQPTAHTTAQSDTQPDTTSPGAEQAEPDVRPPDASQAEEQPSEDSASVTQAERRLAELFEPAEVSLDGPVARYTGVLNEASVFRFLSLVEEHEVEINTLVINSRGGLTHVGQRLGQWIHERQLTLVVEGICLSSCANYIFTAAPRKIIRARAIVGWHGSAQQWSLMETEEDADDEGRNDDLRNSPFSAPDRVDEATVNVVLRRQDHSPEDEERFARSGVGSLGTVVVIETSDRPPDDAWQDAAVQQEQAFLERIDVPADALLWGLMPERIEAYLASGNNFWTFSIDDMRRLGIDNVVYAGQGSYPSAEALSTHAVMLFELDSTSDWPMP